MKKLILVTGSHRSGSTWTGKVISSVKGIHYVHEPFNIGLNRSKSPFSYWYEHLYKGSPIEEKSRNYISSFYSKFFGKAFGLRSKRDAYDYLSSFKGKVSERIVIKDPIALMSAEWIYNNFNCDVVMTIRHPAAFVASLKVKNWQFDFENFLEQEVLMKTYLKGYQNEIQEYATNKPDIIRQGILVWNIIYSTVLSYQTKYRNAWYFVKHEDLSINPMREFEQMFHHLDIEFSEQVKQEIDETTKAKDTSKIKRNSKDNVKTWQQRLSSEEVALIKKETEPVWTHFYQEADWE